MQTTDTTSISQAEVVSEQLATTTGAVSRNAPEFFKDIKPILEENCVACHSNGQIGYSIYPLETARDAVTTAEDIALVTSTKYMPPCLPSENYPL